MQCFARPASPPLLLPDAPAAWRSVMHAHRLRDGVGSTCAYCRRCDYVRKVWGNDGRWYHRTCWAQRCLLPSPRPSTELYDTLLFPLRRV